MKHRQRPVAGAVATAAGARVLRAPAVPIVLAPRLPVSPGEDQAPAGTGSAPVGQIVKRRAGNVDATFPVFAGLRAGPDDAFRVLLDDFEPVPVEVLPFERERVLRTYADEAENGNKGGRAQVFALQIPTPQKLDIGGRARRIMAKADEAVRLATTPPYLALDPPPSAEH